MYAYQTLEGKNAIRKRNQTAQFYAHLTESELLIDPDPLSPIAISFRKFGKIQEVAIVRNRSESMAEFNWPTILITTSKVAQLVARARFLRVPGSIMVSMSDNVLLSWPVVDCNGVESTFVSRVTTTKGDCMGSHMASRQNTFLPIDLATVFNPSQLI